MKVLLLQLIKILQRTISKLLQNKLKRRLRILPGKCLMKNYNVLIDPFFCNTGKHYLRSITVFTFIKLPKSFKINHRLFKTYYTLWEHVLSRVQFNSSCISKKWNKMCATYQVPVTQSCQKSEDVVRLTRTYACTIL